jgi:ATP-dependent Clp protease protease subunit
MNDRFAAPRLEDADSEKSRAPRSLDDRLLRTRTVTLFDPISPSSSKKMITSLLVLESEDAERPVTVLINSPGGSVDDGFAIYDILRFIKCPVRCLSVGLCASAANIVLMGAPKGSRLALPNSRVLLHQPSTGIQGQASDIAIEAREILKLREQLNRMLATETGQPLERIVEDTNRDYWMSAPEAVKYGLFDRVVKERGELA